MKKIILLSTFLIASVTWAADNSQPGIPAGKIGISGLAAEVDGKSLREMRIESLHARSQRFPEASINQNNSTWSIPGNS